MSTTTLDRPCQLRLDWWLRQQETPVTRTVRDERERLLGQLETKRHEIDMTRFRGDVLVSEAEAVRDQLRDLADRDESEVL